MLLKTLPTGSEQISLLLILKKSNFVLFNTQTNIKDNPKIKICIGNSELEQKNSAKYLGIYFDKRLSCDTHIEYINNKINRGIGIIEKVRYYQVLLFC